MGEACRLKAVGYWHCVGAEDYPRPQWLVRRGWHTDELALIVAYLRSGYTFAHWLGFSNCRFGCGIDVRKMGSSDRTDGEWVWPEGLVHYVETHSVFLPEPMVQTMRRNRWRVTKPDLPIERYDGSGNDRLDFCFWRKWARRHRCPPWWEALW
jgi:hypothetical protein